MTRLSRALAGLAAAAVVLSMAAPTPHTAGQQFADFSYAPPMRPHVIDADGRWRRPFIYPLRLVDRIEHRFVEDRSRPVPLRWWREGAVLSADSPDGPWFPLGGDPLGRDVFSRLVRGARLSLGVSLLAAAGALLLGTALGALAGFHGGRLDHFVMRAADFVLVLPGIYVVIVLRATLPLVLSTAEVFLSLAAVLVLAGWPQTARGVRAIIRSERRQEYAEAAVASGAGWWRILHRHLLPATAGYLRVQGSLLLPAFILAESTLSFVGFGFAEPTPSWGVMLQDAAQAGVIGEAPWLAAPALAIALCVFGVHAALGRTHPATDPRPHDGTYSKSTS